MNERGVCAAALILVVVLAGCDYLPFGNTPIRQISEAPANFEGKEVKLAGKVKDLTKVPIVDLKSFALQDDTGEILVMTDGNLPALGERVRLKGTVQSALIIGGQSVGLYVKEIKRLP